MAQGWLGLSLRQPWAWAVLQAGKRIENRSWNTFHRGPILLHAAQGCTDEEYETNMAWMEARGLARRHHAGTMTRAKAVKAVAPRLDQMPRGAFVGVIDLIGVLLPETVAEGGKHYRVVQRTRTERQLVALSGDVRFHEPRYPDRVARVDADWYMPHQHGFILGRVESTRVVRARGMPSLFPVDPAIVRELGLPEVPPTREAA